MSGTWSVSLMVAKLLILPSDSLNSLFCACNYNDMYNMPCDLGSCPLNIKK